MKLYHALLGLSLFAPALLAQSFDEILADYRNENEAQREAYFMPLAEVSGLLASSATFHNGKSHGIAGFDVGLRLPLLMFDNETGTILDENTTEVSTIGMPMLVASKGLPKGFQLSARFMQIELSEDVGELGLLGAGLRWHVNELFNIPLVMPQFALQANWSKLSLGESIESSGMTFDLAVSKKLLLLEVYGGYTTGSMTSTFDYSYEVAGNRVSVNDELDSDVSRLSLGLNWTLLPTLRINAEYGLAESNSLTFGLIMSVL